MKSKLYVLVHNIKDTMKWVSGWSKDGLAICKEEEKIVRQDYIQYSFSKEELEKIAKYLGEDYCVEDLKNGSKD